MSEFVYVVSKSIDMVKRKTRKKHESDLRWQERYRWTPEPVFDTEAEAHTYIRRRAAEAAEQAAKKLKRANERCARVREKFPLVASPAAQEGAK